MANNLISVVIPVYNTEKYLRESIESVLNQTYRHFELIIVNDGSTDSSKDIIDEYAKKDDRIRAFHKQNGGVSSARNFGIDKAKGDYICFIDADDIIEDIYLETLYAALQDGADSSVGGFKHINVPKEKEVTVVPNRQETKGLNESILDFLDYGKTDWLRYMVIRLFRMSVIRQHHLRFREDIYYKEDGLFLTEYLCASNGRVGYTNHIIYYYRQNPESAMGSLNLKYNKRLLTDIEAHLLIIDRLKKSHLPKATIEKARSHAFMSCAWIMDIINNTGAKNFRLSAKLEIYTFKVLGVKRYLKWKIALLSKMFKR